MPVNFELSHTNNTARAGVLHTKHGSIYTPVFMPVGTKATVKGMLPETLTELGFNIILGNTYHLMLTPGADIIKLHGGLQKFINWDGAILTDSGGFQVMSLSSIRKITEDAVTFRSHISGAKYVMTPEISTQIQHSLNANISMVLDECTPFGALHDYAKESLLRSSRWAKRSKEAFIDRDGFGQFGIIQGSIFPDLRNLSVNQLLELNFDGYAIGGLAIGEEQQLMLDIIEQTASQLPLNKPRYLMGVGRPSDILGAIERGVDMFDCVLPTRMARNARAFVTKGELNLRNAKYKTDTCSLDQACNCYVCTNYSVAYLHHLFKVKEMLASILLTYHNLYFYAKMMRDARDAILDNRFKEFKKLFLATY